MSHTISFFEELGARVEAAWRAKHFDTLAFAEVACEALRAMPPAEHVSPEGIIDWLFNTKQLPPQSDVEGPFGHPPIQLFYNERFWIESLFWVDGTTSIHEHAFSGAFHVLSGSSLHSLYGFSSERRINDELDLGELNWQKSEVLQRGDTRPIVAGRSMIHALFHLDRPSVTIVIRTHRDQRVQLTYLPPGIAFEPMRMLPQSRLQQRALFMLLQTDAKRFAATATKYMEQADYSTAFLALHDFAGKNLNSDLLAACVDILRKRDAAAADKVDQALYLHLRTLELTRWRSTVTDPEHRWWMALLLNFPNRRTILDAIAQRYPSESPPALVAKWTKALSTGAAPATAGLTLSGDDIQALENVLADRPQPAALAKNLETLQRARLFDPLFE